MNTCLAQVCHVSVPESPIRLVNGESQPLLANVLEDRRRTLKEHLFSDDEGALFKVANRLDLRHRNDKQHTDCDPAFLDWVF